MTKDHMRRIGIFVFYDREGIVEDYVRYLLESMMDVLDRLVIVCNGEVTKKGRSILESFSTEIMYRKNEGYDGSAYRDALLHFLKKEDVLSSDELILFNDTFYGPFYPIKDVFQEMGSRSCDFWGLSYHKPLILFDEIKSEHVQSYFIVLNKRIINSDLFWGFWENIQDAQNFDEAVDGFEISFSRTLLNAGFKMDSYLKIPEFESEEPSQNYNYAQLCCGTVLSHYRFPVFKKKNLLNSDPLNGDMFRALKYIEDNYSYPFDYILKTIYSKNDLQDLQSSYGLNHIIDVKGRKKTRLAIVTSAVSREFYLDVMLHFDAKDIGIVIDFYADHSVEKLGLDLEFIPVFVFHFADIGNDVLGYIENNRSILQEYDYIGVINDSSNEFRYGRFVDRDFLLSQSLLGKKVLSFVSRYSSKKCRCGLVYPEVRPHDEWSFYWMSNDDRETLESYFARYLPSYHDKRRVLVGHESFWASSEFLKEALSIDHDYSRVWYKFLPYYANHKGFSVFYGADTEASCGLISSYRNTLRLNYKYLQDLTGRVNELQNTVDSQRKEINEWRGKESEYKLIESVALYSFKALYVYGCGIVSNRYSDILDKYGYEISGYIVSDSEEHELIFREKPVFTISEFEHRNEVVVLVGVGNKYHEEVKKQLIEHDVLNIIEIGEEKIFCKTRDICRQRNSVLEYSQHQSYINQLAVDAAPFEYGEFHPTIKSGEELLEFLIISGKSLSRFGDGEFQLMQNKARPWFQSPDEKLAERLYEVFYSDKGNVLIAVPDILGDLRKYNDADATNIRHYLQGEVRQELLKIVGTKRTYYDAYVTRPYLMYKDPEHGKKIFDLFKKLWDNRHVLLVEGEYMRSGVGNDLFKGVGSLKRIVCPARNAFQYYDDIIGTVKENLNDVDLILCALGPTATVLAYDLADTGVQTVDLGQIDNEYEWCKMGATERVPIPGKAVPEIYGQHETGESLDRDYLDQIICRIGC